jgi:hypothetical protein
LLDFLVSLWGVVELLPSLGLHHIILVLCCKRFLEDWLFVEVGSEFSQVGPLFLEDENAGFLFGGGDVGLEGLEDRDNKLPFVDFGHDEGIVYNVAG